VVKLATTSTAKLPQMKYLSIKVNGIFKPIILPKILTSIVLYNHLATTYGDHQQPNLNTSTCNNSWRKINIIYFYSFAFFYFLLIIWVITFGTNFSPTFCLTSFNYNNHYAFAANIYEVIDHMSNPFTCLLFYLFYIL